MKPAAEIAPPAIIACLRPQRSAAYPPGTIRMPPDHADHQHRGPGAGRRKLKMGRDQERQQGQLAAGPDHDQQSHRGTDQQHAQHAATGA